MKERLAFIRSRMEREGMAVFYAWYSPKAKYLVDTDDGTEDFLWMIAEIERLRLENNDLRSPRYSSLVRQHLAEVMSDSRGGKGRKAGDSKERQRGR